MSFGLVIPNANHKETQKLPRIFALKKHGECWWLKCVCEKLRLASEDVSLLSVRVKSLIAKITHTSHQFSEACIIARPFHIHHIFCPGFWSSPGAKFSHIVNCRRHRDICPLNQSNDTLLHFMRLKFPCCPAFLVYSWSYLRLRTLLDLGNLIWFVLWYHFHF